MDLNGNTNVTCKTAKKSISYMVYRDNGGRLTQDELFI